MAMVDAELSIVTTYSTGRLTARVKSQNSLEQHNSTINLYHSGYHYYNPQTQSHRW